MTPRGVAEELAALHELVDRARTKGRTAVVLERDEVLGALARIDAAHSAATQDSRDLVARTDDLLRISEDEASEVLRAARLEQDRLVSDTEVFKVAVREGEEIVARAREEAEGLRADTERYVETRLASLQQALEQTLTEVRRGISNLVGGATDRVTPRPDAGDVLLAEAADG